MDEMSGFRGVSETDDRREEIKHKLHQYYDAVKGIHRGHSYIIGQQEKAVPFATVKRFLLDIMILHPYPLHLQRNGI